MKPEPGQDLTRPNMVTPVFSGALPESFLAAPPKLPDVRFTEQDRRAVAAVLADS